MLEGIKTFQISIFNMKKYKVPALLRVMVVLFLGFQSIGTSTGFSILTHQHQLGTQHQRPLDSQLEDTERDLGFRALLCPAIPPDLLSIYRFHLISRKCYEVGFRGPCGSNMIFVKQPFTRAVGKCVCKAGDALSDARPLIHHPESNDCYFVYKQGYCTPEEWLILDDEESPQCVSNPCRELGTLTENEVESREFITLNGTCVEVGRVNDLCSLGQVVGFHNGRPGCVNPTSIDNEIS